MQINSWEVLHLSPTRAAWPLVTNVHESIGLLVRLNWEGAPGNTDSFHRDILSDHFQPNPFVELKSRPPTQHPLTVSVHSFWAKLNSWTDVSAAKWPWISLQKLSDLSQERELPTYWKHLFLFGPTIQPAGHNAVQRKCHIFSNVTNAETTQVIDNKSWQSI